MNLYKHCIEQGIQITEDKCSLIEQFGGLVVRYNKKTNLISESDESKIVTRHLLDSLQPLKLVEYLPSEGKWADLGSGAGFPVIPLAIALPHIKFYAVEPRLKRQTFLKLVARELSIKNFELIPSNAEESGLIEINRVSCRALGSAEEDWKRAKEMLINNGFFITLKSKKDADLLDNSKWIVKNYELPGESQTYALVVREKYNG